MSLMFRSFLFGGQLKALQPSSSAIRRKGVPVRDFFIPFSSSTVVVRAEELFTSWLSPLLVPVQHVPPTFDFLFLDNGIPPAPPALTNVNDREMRLRLCARHSLRHTLMTRVDSA